MATSDWISLAACVAAFLALVPSFSQMLANRKAEKVNVTSSPLEKGVSNATHTERPKLNALGRAFLLSSMAVALIVIEVVLFGLVASLFGIDVNVNTMPIPWLIVFYALFLVPGVLLWFALLNMMGIIKSKHA